jgi:hypothetical protein
VFYGALLLVFVFALPGGVMDGVKRIRARLVKVIPNPSWLPKDHAEIIVPDAPVSAFPELVTEPSADDLTTTSTTASTD